MKKLLSGIFLLSTWMVYGQTFQNLRGRLSDEDSRRAIAGATLYISGTETQTLTSDSAGVFSAKLSPGEYSVLISHSDYRSVIRNNIVVNRAKQRVEDFILSPAQRTLESITVKAKPEAIEIDPWNIQQFAAVFYDPARVVNSFSGILNTNDQANHVSVRGTSPNYIQWKLESVEIVNPNHLENSGTLNDRPALNGGGVSMISAQLLENSGFQFSGRDPLSGNFLSGGFDMTLRKGNETRSERILQLSLLGMDVSLEGPLSKKHKNAYLFNFRYSTIGLLSKLGINFGDEQSNFMDFSHALSFSHKHGSIKVFGIAGQSETRYRGLSDSTLIEIEKELQDIDYKSETLIQGVSFVTSLSNTMFIKNVFVYSSKDIRRTSALNFDWPGIDNSFEFFRQQKYSSVNYLSKRINHSFRIKAGSYVNYFADELRYGWNVSAPNSNSGQTLLQPFVSLEAQILPKLELGAGMHSMYLPALRFFDLQPRLKLKYSLAEAQEIIFHYGHSAQVQPLFLYAHIEVNRKLVPSRSKTYSVTHQLTLRNNSFKTEFYLQQYDQIPVNDKTGFSGFNYFNEAVYDTLESMGKASANGVDLTFERHKNGFYTIAAASIYNSVYNIRELEKKSRFNTGYNLVITVGKEITLRSQRNFLAIDLRGIYRNGFYDAYGSDSFLFSEQLPAYARLDLRLSYRKNRERSASILALDIQNVTNRQNIGYYYFDRVTMNKQARYQLGLIPVLSYKIMF